VSKAFNNYDDPDKSKDGAEIRNGDEFYHKGRLREVLF
jgi:hypothetical protein